MVEKIEKDNSVPEVGKRKMSPLAISIEDACEKVNELYMELDVILNSTEL